MATSAAPHQEPVPKTAEPVAPPPSAVKPLSPTHSRQTNQPRVVIKSSDMPEDMQRKAVELAITVLDRFELERDMAQYLKREFDERYQPSWHCIVGRHFGSYVTHEAAGFFYFYIDKMAVLLFRSG